PGVEVALQQEDALAQAARAPVEDPAQLAVGDEAGDARRSEQSALERLDLLGGARELDDQALGIPAQILRADDGLGPAQPRRQLMRTRDRSQARPPQDGDDAAHDSKAIGGPVGPRVPP